MQAKALVVFFAAALCRVHGQTSPAPAIPSPQPATAASSPHRLDEIERALDEVRWRLALADLAHFDEIRYTSAPSRRETNPTGQGAGNPLIIHALTFIPRKIDRSKKHPLIVFAHGGVHSRFGISSLHIVRELLEQGYSIVAPDYRGSTGYGIGFYNQIDYGGLEVVDAGRAWMLENYAFLDPKRVGMIGWSHGGLITLLNIFDRPQSYAAAYAGVPVSDLVARMGYKSANYRTIFSAPGHIGKSAEDDVKEYLRRSPVTHVKKLQTPLLVHTTTNDEDVNVLEVQRLIAALKAEGKTFVYKIYQDAPGGHVFKRLDTALAKESRTEIYKFLAGILKPSP